MYSTNVYLKNINGDILSSVQTDNSGAYQFINVSNGEYRIECTTAINWGGANPLDALYVNRNYIGTYNFGDALKKKAADVNLDNKVNPVDALSINRRFTGLITQFTAPDWMFEAANIIVNGGNVTQNIKAICAGDVDGSYNP
jgi:hypothetical protein